MAKTQPHTIDLDLELRRRRFELQARIQSRSSRVALIGPSGAGKTTLLRVLAGLERAARGRVRFSGTTWQDTASGVWVPAWQRQIGWAPQRALLYPHRSVAENLLDGATHDSPQAVARMLDIEALLDRRPKKLSGGERQRVALGRALLCEPKLLLLDEPFSALDRSLRAEVTEALLVYCDARNLPLVLVTHDERDVSHICDEVWEVSGGVVEQRR